MDECKPLHPGHTVHQRRGRAVQVDPIKPTLKAPKFQLLELEHEEVLSNCGFKVKLRRYTVVAAACTLETLKMATMCSPAGAYTRPLFSST